MLPRLLQGSKQTP